MVSAVAVNPNIIRRQRVRKQIRFGFMSLEDERAVGHRTCFDLWLPIVQQSHGVLIDTINELEASIEGSGVRHLQDIIGQGL